MATHENSQFEKIDELIEQERFGSARVQIVGAGTMGATVGLALVTHGCATRPGSQITAIDHDLLESRNLVGTPYLYEHVGGPKVDGFADLAQRKSGSVKVTTWRRKIGRSDIPEMEDRAHESDLFLWAAEPTEDLMAVAEATSPIVPQVMAVFGEHCDFGEVAFSVPGETPTINETMGQRARKAITKPSALGCDTDFVASFVAAVCMQLLLGDAPSPYLPQLYGNAPLFVVGLRPRWVFESMPADQPRSIYIVGKNQLDPKA